MKLLFKSLAKENLNDALAVAKVIFPEDYETAELGYKASLNLADPRWATRRLLDYYIVVDEDADQNKIIAITGFYNWTTHAEDEVWLGWYGVMPEARGKGIGRKVLEWTLKKAKERGYKKFRLWTTTSLAEASAQKLYDSMGLKVYKEEEDKEDGYTILSREIDL